MGCPTDMDEKHRPDSGIPRRRAIVLAEASATRRIAIRRPRRAPLFRARRLKPRHRSERKAHCRISRRKPPNAKAHSLSVSRETACRATEVRRDGMTRFPDDLQATISEVVASTTGRRSEGKPSVVCVSGGRGSGKNTHARVAANAILFAQGRVAVLDGDCANPLFGAPGVLTLSVFDEPIPAVGSPACFSERWLRRRAPLAAFFVGPTRARDDPAAYAASLERLTRAWARFRQREDAEKVSPKKDATTRGPTVLVVNCAGWSKGLGADLVMKTTQLTRATHALRFGAARRGAEKKNVFAAGDEDVGDIVVARAPADAGAGVLQWMVWGMECVLAHDGENRNGLASTTDDDGLDDATRRFLLGEDGIPEKTTGSQKRRREKELKSFSETLSETDPNVWAFLADRFTALRPWKVRVADVAVLVEDGSGALARAREPPDIVVGSVAGLCFVGGDGGDDDDEARRFFPACRGLGLIRSASVDASGAIDFVYVLTPLSAAALESVNALVCRHTYPPSRLCKASGAASVSSPPFWTGASLAAEGTGAGVIRSRNNILRKGGAGKTKGP